MVDDPVMCCDARARDKFSTSVLHDGYFRIAPPFRRQRYSLIQIQRDKYNRVARRRLESVSGISRSDWNHERP